MKFFRYSKEVIAYIYANRLFFIPGIILFFALFLLSTFMNFGLSYMGNTNKELVSLIVRNYLFTIILQLIKILITYLLIGAVLSAVFYTAVREVQKRYKVFKRSEGLLISITTLACLLLYVILFVSKRFIMNPQPYVENFASHSGIFKNYLYFLTDNVNPVIFDFFIALLFITAFLFIFLSVDWRALKPKKILSARYLKTKITIILAIIFAYILYENNIIFFNRSNDLPNILVISSDALRPDHMSFNGYPKKTTPALDSLAKESLQIKGTFSALPRTFPSWVSILTSRYPMSHGINHMFPRTRERNIKFKTATDRLNELGYNTAVNSDFAGDIFPRIDLGFQKVYAPDMNTPVLIRQIILEKQTFLLPFITNRAGLYLFPEMLDLAKLSFPRILSEETINEIRSSRGKPFFILTFYSITHFPFSPPYPYYKKFSNSKYNGAFKYFKDRIIKLDKNNDLNPQDVTREDKIQVNDLYDACLNLFDKETGRIIDFLKKERMMNNTIIIITSDHGENLYEKDFGMGHGEHLRGNYALEVPLIIYHSKIKNKGETIKVTSSTVDIMPTVFDIAGLSAPDYFDGTSILKKISRGKTGIGNSSVDAYCETGMWFDNDKSSPFFSHHQRIDYPDISGVSEIDFSYRDEVVISQKFQNIVNGAKHRAIYSGRYKLIYLPLPEGPRIELYDFIADPDNSNDLSGVRKDILDIMKKKFYNFIDEKGSGNFIIKKGILFPAFVDPVF